MTGSLVDAIPRVGGRQWRGPQAGRELGGIYTGLREPELNVKSDQRSLSAFRSNNTVEKPVTLSKNSQHSSLASVIHDLVFVGYREFTVA
jgi:hypothetical protein